MKSIVIAIICLLLSLFKWNFVLAGHSATLPGKKHITQQDTIKKKLEHSIPSLMNEYKVPAVGVALIENGKLSWVKVYGELKRGQPAPQDAIFNTASVGKTFTALLTLKLIDAKQWTLDESLANYWIDEDIKDHRWLQKLTTRHVLSHRTGFKNWRNLYPTGKLDFDFEPGTDYQYSGEGMAYLKNALEAKFKIPFDKLIDSFIFKPLAMNNSQYWSEKLDRSKFAYSHDINGEVHQRVTYEKEVSAAGNIHTTAADLAKFGIYILNGAGLSPSLYGQMITHQGTEKQNSAFGLGWTVVQGLPKGEYALVHGGDDIGVHAMLVLLPKSKRGMVVLTNGDNGSLLIDKVTKTLVDLNPRRTNPAAITLDNKVLDRYTGSYLQTDGRIMKVERSENVLKISAEGIPLLELTAESEKNFFIRDYRISMEFIPGADGQEMNIKIMENGKLVMEAKRR